MTNDERNDNDGLEGLFTEADLISRYTDREAVEDGILYDVTELSRVSPSIKWKDGPFQYVTTNLATSKGYLKEDSTPSVPNFLDLFRTMGAYMQQTGPDDFYSTTIEFPNGTKGTVYAERNMSGGYTIMLPEDR